MLPGLGVNAQHCGLSFHSIVRRLCDRHRKTASPTQSLAERMMTMASHAPLRLTDFTTTDVMVHQMGHGGFGLVYMGPDQGAGGQWRALKTLRPELLALRPQLNELFVTEGLTWVGLWTH